MVVFHAHHPFPFSIIFFCICETRSSKTSNHGLNIYIETKAKCRHLKKWPENGFCGRCLTEFIDWRYSQSCWYFRPSFVNCCPSNLLVVQLSPLPCVNKYTYLYTRCIVCKEGGVISWDSPFNKVVNISDYRNVPYFTIFWSYKKVSKLATQLASQVSNGGAIVPPPLLFLASHPAFSSEHIFTPYFCHILHLLCKSALYAVYNRLMGQRFPFQLKFMMFRFTFNFIRWYIFATSRDIWSFLHGGKRTESKLSTMERNKKPTSRRQWNCKVKGGLVDVWFDDVVQQPHHLIRIV